jgi:hypothetical protein
MVIFAGEFAAAAAMRKHLLRAPFCDAHKNHWMRRTIWILAILGMVGVFVVGLLALLALIIVSPAVALIGALFWVVALSAAAWNVSRLNDSSILCFLVHPDYLFLWNVSKEFCDSMDRLRGKRATAPPGPFSAEDLAQVQQYRSKRQRFAPYILPLFAVGGVMIFAGVGVGLKLMELKRDSTPPPQVKKKNDAGQGHR